jgi:hypothetical protein
MELPIRCHHSGLGNISSLFAYSRHAADHHIADAPRVELVLFL